MRRVGIAPTQISRRSYNPRGSLMPSLRLISRRLVALLYVYVELITHCIIPVSCIANIVYIIWLLAI